MKGILPLVFLICLLLSGCAGNDSMQRKFEDIDRICDNIPRQAMSMLDSIDYEALSERDRHRYDLLTIKSRDKAYVRHVSDSLILDVIDYYMSHPDEGLSHMALYYGGRVYSDLGDLPTALEYFQKAIDSTPDDEGNLRFKRSLLSQTGRLLNSIRLHRQSTPYIEKAIDISRILNDSAGVFYDNMILIQQYINIDSLRLARKHLYEAYKYSRHLSEEDKAWLNIRHADLLLHEGKTDSALFKIQPIITHTDTLCRNYALAVAADICHQAGINKGAYLYAKELAASNTLNNRLCGFNILFSPEIYPLIPIDSISYYVKEYGKYVDEYMNRNESQEVMLQNSKYNYAQHIRQQEKAEKEKIQTEKEHNLIMGTAIFIILTLSIIILYMKYRNVKTEMRLRMAIQLVSEIGYLIHINSDPNLIPASQSAEPIKAEPESVLLINSRNQIFRQELLDKLNNICGEEQWESTSDDRLRQKPIIKRLLNMISEGNGITHSDKKIWHEIEKAVMNVSPEFKSRLMILTMNKMTEKEYHVALMIKCGIIPKDVATLLNRTKSTVTDRRTSLSRKIFGSSADNTSLDKLISRL